MSPVETAIVDQQLVSSTTNKVKLCDLLNRLIKLVNIIFIYIEKFKFDNSYIYIIFIFFYIM